MVSSICETIRLDLDLPERGPYVQVMSGGKSLEATCAAMAATYYWALCHKAANSRMKADGYVVEVRHVER